MELTRRFGNIDSKYWIGCNSVCIDMDAIDGLTQGCMATLRGHSMFRCGGVHSHFQPLTSSSSKMLSLEASTPILFSSSSSLSDDELQDSMTSTTEEGPALFSSTRAFLMHYRSRSRTSGETSCSVFS